VDPKNTSPEGCYPHNVTKFRSRAKRNTPTDQTETVIMNDVHIEFVSLEKNKLDQPA